jgi:hypothetical protein
VITWLLGAKPFLEGAISQPEQFNKLAPDIQWALSHALKGEDEHGRCTIPFVSDVNVETFRAACNATLPAAERKVWIAQVTSVPLLHREMGYLAEQFADFCLEV